MSGAPRLFADLLAREFNSKKDEMLRPLHELQELESRDANAVKAKERLLRQYETRAMNFTALADIWCADFFRKEGDEAFSNEEYGQLIRSLSHPRTFKQLLEQKKDVLSR